MVMMTYSISVILLNVLYITIALVTYNDPENGTKENNMIPIRDSVCDCITYHNDECSVLLGACPYVYRW